MVCDNQEWENNVWVERNIQNLCCGQKPILNIHALSSLHAINFKGQISAQTPSEIFTRLLLQKKTKKPLSAETRCSSCSWCTQEHVGMCWWAQLKGGNTLPVFKNLQHSCFHFFFPSWVQNRNFCPQYFYPAVWWVGAQGRSTAVLKQLWPSAAGKIRTIKAEISRSSGLTNISGLIKFKPF